MGKYDERKVNIKLKSQANSLVVVNRTIMEKVLRKDIVGII